ncbi:MAG: hypothetical protein RIT81_21670 [Deltaproteobacteria bacterium]
MDPVSPQARFKARFGKLARDPAKFEALMKEVYGDDFDRGKAESLRQRALAGDFGWLPKVEVVPDADMNGGRGAYDAKSKTIYLSESTAKDPAKAAAVFAEEVGHHLDTELVAGETRGDEGEHFARRLAGEKLSAAQIAAIRSEDDRGVINVGGRQVEVEFSLFSKIGKAIGGVAKKVVSGAKKVFNGAKKVVSGVAKKVVGGVKRVAEKVTGGIKKIAQKITKFASPIMKVLDKVAPFLSFIPGIGQVVGAGYAALKAAKALATGKLSDLIGGIASFVPGGSTLGKGLAFAQRALGVVKTVEQGADALERGDLLELVGVGQRAGVVPKTPSLDDLIL